MQARRVLCVIPMRSGSKGIHNKNIRDLCGQPLFSWIAQTAAQSNLIDRMIVSTDSQKYADLANHYGVETPFIRPAYLSGDKVRLHHVLKHALEYFDANGKHFDAVLSCQPTAPLVRVETIDQMILDFHSSGCQAVGTGSEIVQGHPYLAKTLDEETGLLNDFVFLKEGVPRYPRQIRPKLFYFNGSAFLRDRQLLDEIDEDTNCLGNDPKMVLSPGYTGLNIDEEIDFSLAEIIMKKKESLSNAT